MHFFSINFAYILLSLIMAKYNKPDNDTILAPITEPILGDENRVVNIKAKLIMAQQKAK